MQLSLRCRIDSLGLPLSQVRSALHAAWADEEEGLLSVSLGAGKSATVTITLTLDPTRLIHRADPTIALDPLQFAQDHPEFARAFESFPADADRLYPAWRSTLDVAA